MSNEPNTDAVDILSELGNNTDDIKDTSSTNVTNESDEIIQTESMVKQETSLDTKNEPIRNVIFVGNKTIMIYVNSTLTKLSASPFVTIKARGKRITQAVDISQFIMKRMNSVGYKISDVRISSESLVSQDGKKRNVSLLEIDISNSNI